LTFSDFSIIFYEFPKFSTLKRRKNQNLSYRPSERVESSQIHPSAMAGWGKLGFGSNLAREGLGWQGEGGGE
jgi:hypothetical protein